MKPHSRQEFKDYCLRSLGFPVLDINVEDDQVEDRIDEALNYWKQYHMEGTEKIYYKHLVTEVDKINQYITLPENIMGAVRVFPLSSFIGNSSDLFSIEYQIAMQNLFVFDSTPLIPYYMSRLHVETIHEMLVGEPIIRFNRHRNRLHIDWNWNKTSPARLSANSGGTISMSTTSSTLSGTSTSFLSSYANNGYMAIYSDAVNYEIVQVNQVLTNTLMSLKENAPFTNTAAVAAPAEKGEYLLVEAYEALDPNTFTDMWSDRFLEKYTTALIKRQWGNNIKKFNNMQLPGGVMMNGQQIYDEAEAEIKELEMKMLDEYSLPPDMQVG